MRCLWATFLLAGLSTGLDAQIVGDPVTTPLSSGQGTLTLNFETTDHELILYSRNVSEADTSRSYAYEVLGTAASKVIPLARRPLPQLTPHDELSLLLKAEEQTFSSIPLQDRDRLPAWKQSTPAVGSTRNFAFIALGDVTTDRSIVATLVALNDKALAYVDNVASDSVNTVTTADVQAIIDEFSASSQPLIDSTFGGPSDIDGDGKILFLFSPVIDEVGQFGGFFRSGSLFETNVGGDGNLADMIYLSPSRSAETYESLVAHEYQHLVNYNQHFFVNGGDGEESWLNEALSHFTEDLVGGHVDGGNTSRLKSFLDAPENFRLNGDAFASSGIRGGAYLSLQTMMDIHGDGILSTLLNTSLTGVENVENAINDPFESLLETFFIRNYLSGSGLNSDATLAYGSSVLTDPVTGGRVIPPVMDRQIALPGTAVTGLIRPAAAAYFRLTAEGGVQSLQITGTADADLVAVTIPVDRDFQPHNVLPTDYFPNITLDAPLRGDFTTGQNVVVEGTLANPADELALFSFEPIDVGLDTIKFEAPATLGRFKGNLLLGHDKAGDYVLKIFSGQSGESLPFVGQLPRVIVRQGDGPIDLPVDFFPGIVFDTTVPTSVTTGETVRLAGTVSDPTVQVVLMTLVDAAGQSIEAEADVTNGRFELILLLAQNQTGAFTAQIFMGLSGQTLPFVGRFPSFAAVEGEGAFSLPTDFFDGMNLDAEVPTQITAGEGFSFAGTVSDPTIEVLLFILTDAAGNEIRFQFNARSGAFRQGIVFFPSQAGEYTLNVFGGPSGGSLPARGWFSPVTVQSAGSEIVVLPTDIFDGVLLDEPLPTDFFDGQTRTISGTLTDTAPTQLVMRFDFADGTAGPSVSSDVANGRFSIETPAASLDPGDYTIVIFAGQSGGSLPFVAQFGPISILSSQPRVNLSADQLTFNQTETGSSATLALTLDNTGSENLFITEATIESGPFSVSPSAAEIAAGATGSLDVTFSPTEGGTVTGTLRFVTNDPTRSTVTVTLTGTAPEPPPPVAMPVLNVSSVDWGTVIVGATASQSVVLENASIIDLTIDSVRVSGPFTVTPVTGLVEPGGSLTFDLVFDAQEVGPVTGSLTIHTSDPPTALTVSLAATGAEPWARSPDINGDGNVDFSDFLELAGAFGKSEGQEGYRADVDFNGDMRIGFSDFLILAGQFGK